MSQNDQTHFKNLAAFAYISAQVEIFHIIVIFFNSPLPEIIFNESFLLNMIENLRLLSINKL